MLKRTSSPNALSRALSALGLAFGRFPLNDPTTPDLAADMGMPSVGFLKYAVQGMSMQPSNPNESRALNCHVQVGHCINAVQASLKKPLQGWAATKLLQVVPAAGAEMNAYYDRRSLRFFYHNHRGRNVYFGDSADIVTHELGHAILDAMRPDFWSVQSLEIWSFHEAFSDIVAVFNMLRHDKSVDAVLAETGGDLRLSNHASRLAEEVGRLLRDVTGDPTYPNNALRDPASERFLYVKPSSLPKEAPNDKLAAECHSFGRVFSSAWYEAFVRGYEYEVSKGSDRPAALKKSRDKCFSTVLKAVPMSPRVTNYYEAVAKCMVAAAADEGDAYRQIFSSVFAEWGMTNPDSFRVLSSKSWSELVVQLKRKDMVVKTKGGAVMSMRRPAMVRVGDLPLVSGLSESKDLKLEIPFDSYYEFDKDGRLVAEMTPDKDRLFEDVAECMSHISGEIGPGSMWEPKEGRLERAFIR